MAELVDALDSKSSSLGSEGSSPSFGTIIYKKIIKKIMNNLKLEVLKRSPEDKVKKLLSENKIVWVIYWPKSTPISISFSYKEFINIYRVVKKWKTFDISLDWKSIKVMIKDFDIEPIYHVVRHVDFLVVADQDIVTAEIWIKLFWNSEAVKVWWVLRQELDFVKIKAKVSDLPDHFDVDITELANFKSSIKVWSLSLAESMTLITKKDVIIASIIVPRAVAAASDENSEQDAPKESEEKKEWDDKKEEEKK